MSGDGEHGDSGNYCRGKITQAGGAFGAIKGRLRTSLESTLVRDSRERWMPAEDFSKRKKLANAIRKRLSKN